MIPYKGKEWTWNHVIIEGYCLWTKKNGTKDINKLCIGEVSDGCLGKSGKKCRFFGHTSIEPAERKAMMDGWKEFNRTHELAGDARGVHRKI